MYIQIALRCKKNEDEENKKMAILHKVNLLNKTKMQEISYILACHFDMKAYSYYRMKNNAQKYMKVASEIYNEIGAQYIKVWNNAIGNSLKKNPINWEFKKMLKWRCWIGEEGWKAVVNITQQLSVND